jgi:fatty-acyl-CoA synthase
MPIQTPSADAFVAPKDGLSYVRGSIDLPLSEATIGQFLLDTARRFPERAAVVFCEQGIRWTWQQFADEVDVLASGLASLGIVKGDRVGIWSPNRVEWLLTQFATARIGAVLVNINPAYRLAELEYALNKVGCKAIIAAERCRASMYLEMLQALAPELAEHAPGDLHAARLPALRIVIRMCDTATPGMLSFSEVIEDGRVALDPARLAAIDATLSANDPINIQFTSGTTGDPKGATLTQHNIVNNARYIAMAMRLTEEDALCIPVPLYHCFGMVLAVLASVSAGAKMVFPGEVFDPGATLAAASEERCTALHGVPTMFIAELDHPDFATFDLSSLRTGIMAGSPCPIETMKRVVSTMHLAEITIAYGMTETSPVSFQSSTTDPLEKRTTTVGRIQPHLEAKIVDAFGQIVPVGETGELCTKGYSVMLGYWGDAVRTREAIVDGWMRTGDPRDARQRGLLQHRRAAERHADSRRREHLPARDRGIPVSSSQDSERAGVRRARPEVRRGSMRMDRAAHGRADERRGREGVLPRTNRALQGAALRPLRRRAADDGHRQGAEIRHARTDDRGTEAGTGEDGMTGVRCGACKPRASHSKRLPNKKKRAWSPLKTTRYGVSARRPMKEPTAQMTPLTVPAGMPLPRRGIRHGADRLRRIVSAHTLHRGHIRVETVEGHCGRINLEVR